MERGLKADNTLDFYFEKHPFGVFSGSNPLGDRSDPTAHEKATTIPLSFDLLILVTPDHVVIFYYFSLISIVSNGACAHSTPVVTVAILAQGTILGANATRRPFLSLGFEPGSCRFSLLPVRK